MVDGPRSVVWQQATNRMHAQRGLLLWLLAPALTPRLSTGDGLRRTSDPRPQFGLAGGVVTAPGREP